MFCERTRLRNQNSESIVGAIPLNMIEVLKMTTRQELALGTPTLEQKDQQAGPAHWEGPSGVLKIRRARCVGGW